jgi:hypothetical protein
LHAKGRSDISPVRCVPRNDIHRYKTSERCKRHHYCRNREHSPQFASHLVCHPRYWRADQLSQRPFTLAGPEKIVHFPHDSRGSLKNAQPEQRSAGSGDASV